MLDVETHTSAAAAPYLNVADRLSEIAREMPNATAVVCSRKASSKYRVIEPGNSGTRYATITFAELDADATRIARGLLAWGVPPGARLALLVRPGIEFVGLVFGLLRAGMVIVLVDPGLGRRNLVRCLAEAQPEGFVAIGLAQASRLWLRRKFSRARWNVTVGRRWFWGGVTLKRLRALGATGSASARDEKTLAEPVAREEGTRADDPAAIIFTSGSTGAPKGALYTQRMFDTQVAEIQAAYGIERGGVDLACFPLFALFNSAMGVTTVLPKMNFSRPASAKPQNLLAAANDWRVTQAFASPAVWRVLSAHCAKTGERIDSLRQVFSCGAPVPADVLRATLACVGKGARMHTPYGATECLPVATIEAAEVLGETAARTDEGAGVCVGRKFDSIEWRVIRITDDPIATIEETEELPVGEIGELMVRGPQVSPKYVTRVEANVVSKIGGGPDTEYLVQSTQNDSDSTALPHSPFPTPHSPLAPWHRTGDVGYLDATGRFWYCGRKSQRVETAVGPLYTECVEAIFNSHPAVMRSALVGIGAQGAQVPVIVFQREPKQGNKSLCRALLELANATEIVPAIEHVLEFARLPVDVRHNAKIHREALAHWAAAAIRPAKRARYDYDKLLSRADRGR